MQNITLSVLTNFVKDVVDSNFYGKRIWLTVEITDVKKYESKRWCFLKFVEKRNDYIVAEMQGVFWAASYNQIENFEQITKIPFASGIEITCAVEVKFHEKFGLKLEVKEIDASFTLGKLIDERKKTLNRLLAENPDFIKLEDEEYLTYNNQMPLPKVIQRIALITAPNSDGQRDFKQELANNKYGYGFCVIEYLTTVQGTGAERNLLAQLNKINSKLTEFDAVVMVRGGGSDTDFAPFNDYDLCKAIAQFNIPVFTGIGHDRNTSIADLMARQLKTPTKVAAAIIDINLSFESNIIRLHERLTNKIEHIFGNYKLNYNQWKKNIIVHAQHQVVQAKTKIEALKKVQKEAVLFTLQAKQIQLQKYERDIIKGAENIFLNKKQLTEHKKQLIKHLSPQNVLNRGYAIVMKNEQIITDSAKLKQGDNIKTILKDSSLISTVEKTTANEEHEF